MTDEIAIEATAFTVHSPFKQNLSKPQGAPSGKLSP